MSSQPILLTLAFTFLFFNSIQADDKPDSRIQAVVDYFGKNCFKMEKSKEGGWDVIDPKFDGWYINIYFKSFPTNATEEEMWKVLRQINLAFIPNAPAKLAMSYPGLRADAPGEPKRKAPDLKKLGIHDKMIKLFKEYRPAEVKK
ncbi:MAG: hypothetical protein JNJ77_17775 [Planctomycetia bacterium]|nr:hypothetical protein [Planctomycetia bacterium]